MRSESVSHPAAAVETSLSYSWGLTTLDIGLDTLMASYLRQYADAIRIG